MKYFKLALINSLVFLLFWTVTEAFFQLNAKFALIKKPNFQFNPEQASTHLESDAVRVLGTEKLTKIPHKFQLRQDARLLNYSYNDLEREGMYPKDYMHEPENKSYRVVLKVKNTDTKVYDVIYRFDSYGFRAVENQSNKKKSDKFVLSVGDSFTFGEGVTQGLDYPSQLAEKLNSEWKVYNYGVQGYGPNDFYLKAKNPDYFKRVIEKKGIFVWIYINDQMVRMVCPTSCSGQSSNRNYIGPKPEFAFEGDQVIDHGTFENSSRFKRKILNVLHFSETLKFLGFDYPNVYTGEMFNNFFTLLNKGLSGFELSHQLTKKFIVVYDHVINYEAFVRAANKANFEVIRYTGSNFPYQLVQKDIIPDMHPSSESYWIISELIKMKNSANYDDLRFK